MDKFASAVIYEKPETFALRQFPIPHIADGDMLIEVLVAGVDGSELHMFNGEMEFINNNAPVVFGDEIIGKVVAIGDDAAARRSLKLGDVVAVEAKWPCNKCPSCLQNQYYLCRNGLGKNGYGTRNCAEPPHLWGGYATHVFVPPEALVYRVPNDLSLNTALVACSLLANSARWSELAKSAAGQTVVVIGPGPQGIGCALAAVDVGAKVLVVGLERDATRLEFAAKFATAETMAISGKETHQQVAEAIRAIVGEVDSVIETAGSAPAKQLALELVKPMGTVVHISWPKPLEQPVNWMTLLMKEVTVLNPMSHPYFVDRGFELAQRLKSQGIDVGEMVTHSFGLKDCEHAIRVAAYQTDEVPIKVVIEPSLDGR
ncbi:zinc-dependent alcohol dehydrogenase [Aquisediminimonas profunda]|uniref:zinc-dependent alcohol dehydrogenase n=1 Tax=Aquisediminimonas profunda TaxID=1550733 RepID=UPI001C627054|nr:zinc-binding dehydrogenase [Aquisediminimonas profunda]